MKFPSEETIDAIFSEMKSHAIQLPESNHSECELCQFSAHLESVSTDEKNSTLDEIMAFYLIANDPLFAVSAGLEGRGALLISMWRFAFLFGFKAGKAVATEELISVR